MKALPLEAIACIHTMQTMLTTPLPKITLKVTGEKQSHSLYNPNDP